MKKKKKSGSPGDGAGGRKKCDEGVGVKLGFLFTYLFTLVSLTLMRKRRSVANRLNRQNVHAPMTDRVFPVGAA